MGATSSKGVAVVETAAAPVAAATTDAAAAGDKPKCKACCACPETKRARDAW